MIEKQKTHRGLKGEDEGMSAARLTSEHRKKDEGSGMQNIAMILGFMLLIAALANTFLVMQIQDQNNKMFTAIADNTAAVQTLAANGINQNQVVATTNPGGTTASTTPGNANQKVSIIVLNDKRCTACMTSGDSIVQQLKTVFPSIESRTVDYNSAEGKKLYAEANLKALPAMLFTDDVKTAQGYSDVSQYLSAAGNYLSLAIGANYDPTCYKDDGSIDCSKPECASRDVSCSQKAKPVVEAFVMAYCPYGTQIEKGLIPAVKALGNSIDFSVKFCDYAMHGEKEVDEELSQYCIETQQNDKYLTYLDCFLVAGNSTDCIKSTGIDTAKLATCISETDAKYKIKASFNDKSTWIGGNFPPFDIYKDLTTKYNVRGSPTFVVNGVTMDSVGRDPQSLLDAICKGFTQKPAACSQKLSTSNPSAGFGTSADTSGTAAAGGCATA